MCLEQGKARTPRKINLGARGTKRARGEKKGIKPVLKPTEDQNQTITLQDTKFNNRDGAKTADIRVKLELATDVRPVGKAPGTRGRSMFYETFSCWPGTINGGGGLGGGEQSVPIRRSTAVNGNLHLNRHSKSQLPGGVWSSAFRTHLVTMGLRGNI